MLTCDMLSIIRYQYYLKYTIRVYCNTLMSLTSLELSAFALHGFYNSETRDKEIKERYIYLASENIYFHYKTRTFLPNIVQRKTQ